MVVPVAIVSRFIAGNRRWQPKLSDSPANHFGMTTPTISQHREAERLLIFRPDDRALVDSWEL